MYYLEILHQCGQRIKRGGWGEGGGWRMRGIFDSHPE